MRQLMGKVASTGVRTCSAVSDPVTQFSSSMPRNRILFETPILHPATVTPFTLQMLCHTMTRAVCDAQRAAQRQPGPSRGDPAGWAERPPTPTAGCLDRPSFGATVDHRVGACGLAQQRRDQLHHARAVSGAGPDLRAVSTGAGCAPREIDRSRTPVRHRPSVCARRLQTCRATVRNK